MKTPILRAPYCFAETNMQRLRSSSSRSQRETRRPSRRVLEESLSVPIEPWRSQNDYIKDSAQSPHRPARASAHHVGICPLVSIRGHDPRDDNRRHASRHWLPVHFVRPSLQRIQCSVRGEFRWMPVWQLWIQRFRYPSRRHLPADANRRGQYSGRRRFGCGPGLGPRWIGARLDDHRRQFDRRAGPALLPSVDVFTATGLTLRNANSSGSGGGMNIGSGVAASLEGVRITQNAAEYGGGISSASGTAVTLTNVMVDSNTADWDGGGVAFDSSTFSLVDSDIIGNQVTGYQSDGAGVLLSSGTGTFLRVNIADNINIQGYDGGGIYVDYSEVHI